MELDEKGYPIIPEDLKNKPQSEWTYEDWERSGGSGRTTSVAAPWDYVLGAVAAKPLVGASIGKYGLDKTLEVGLNAVFPDVQDSLLEQGLRSKQMGLAATAVKGTRIAYDKILNSAFDPARKLADWGKRKIDDLTGLYKTGTGFGAESDDVLPSGIGKEIPDAFAPSLDPSGPKTWFQKGKRREISSELTTGKKVTPDVIKEFNDEGATAAKALEAQLNIPLGETDTHHIGWIRQIFESMNGLTQEFRLKSTKYYERSLGIELGYSRKNATPLPKLFHPRLHALVNKRIGGGEGVFNLTRLEKKFNLPKDWKKTTEYGQRLKIYREIVNTIGHSVKHIDHFWNGLKSRTNQLGKLNKEQYMKTVFDLLELDEKLLDLKHIPLMRSKPGVNTASDIINDILSNANKVDLSLPKFSKLSVTDLNAVAKVEIINQQILREALLSKQSANTVFEAYKDVIGISRRQFNNILNQIDPNKLMQKGMSIEDVDTYLRSGWGDPTKAKSSLIPIDTPPRTDYTIKQLKDMGRTPAEIQEYIDAGWVKLDYDDLFPNR